MSFELHKLELNYRSDMRICAVANLLIRHNKERVDKDCVPVSTEMGRISLANWEDAGQELAWIAGYQREEGRSIAVLYRMNYDVKVCRDYLRAMCIPIQEQKYEQRPPDWERALLVLGLLQSPENEILVERFLRLDRNDDSVQRWLLEARAKGLPLLGSTVQFGDCFTMGDVLRLLAQNTVSEGTVRLIQQRAELLAPDADLSDLIHALHEPEEPGIASNDAGVYVGTMHSAKGREWDVVFLPAFEQGIIPSIRATATTVDPYSIAEQSRRDSTALEEERRLAFVAVTRARHELYISHCTHRRGPYGPVGMGQPSQFIKEMGL